LAKRGGSRKGKPNKSTQDIKKLLDERVDFGIVIDKLMELVNGVQVQKVNGGQIRIYTDKPDSFAAKILLEYRFGKAPQPTDFHLPEGKRLIIEDEA